MYTVYVQYVWYVYYCIHSSVRPSMHVHFVCIQCIYTVYASRYYTVYVYYVCKLLSYLFLYIHLSVRPLMPLSDRPTLGPFVHTCALCGYFVCVLVCICVCALCVDTIYLIYMYTIYMSICPSLHPYVYSSSIILTQID